MPEILTESELVSLLLDRREEGYSYLYDRYSGALFAAALRIVGDEAIAGDVLQETIIRIWQQIATYDSTKGRLYTWMVNICRNKAIDQLRSKHIKYQIQNSDELVFMESQGAEHMQTDHIGLSKVLMQLPLDQRQAVELVYYGGYTHDEAAAELNIPLGTLKTRVRTAMTKLRTLLKRDIIES